MVVKGEKTWSRDEEVCRVDNDVSWCIACPVETRGTMKFTSGCDFMLVNGLDVVGVLKTLLQTTTSECGSLAWNSYKRTKRNNKSGG